MADMEKETVITSYNGNLYKRLLNYAKPFAGRFAIAIVLVLSMTVFALVKPLLISEAIDTYICGYNLPYGEVDESEAELCYQGKYLSKDYEGKAVKSYSQILEVEGQYYYFENLTVEQSSRLTELSNQGIENYHLNSDSISIDFQGNTYEGTLLVSEDLEVLRSSDMNGILRIALMYGIVLVLNSLANAAQKYILLKNGQDIVYNIRNEVFQHIHTLPLRFFDTHAVGQTVTRVTNDVESLNRMYSFVLVNLISNFTMIAGYAIVMISLNLRMALIGFILLPLVFALTYIFRKLMRKIYRVIRTKVTRLNIYLSEHISGMKLIQIFAKEEDKFKQFEGESDDLFGSRMKELMTAAIFRPVINFIANMALAIIILRGGNLVLQGTITVGVLYVFTSYIRSFFDPIQELAEQFSTLQNAFASAEKIFTLLDEKNTILEKENPVVLDQVKGKIEFKHVWFAYENENYVLRDVSFVIEPGQKVAFVGATGAGKSSILNLIGRYYDIQQGEILIDDVNIKDLTTEQIRKAIGQVQQDVFIFTGDVKSNIALLNPEITIDQVQAAAKAVNADTFIEKLPNQYDEELSERGANLSFGQRQLLSFARTLVIDPTILVMDEATANIDTETEQLIQDALETLMKGRTTIMVAHRLSTIQHADNIIVLHHGKIRESGTHQQLLAQNGIYKKLYELQLDSKQFS